MGHSKVSSKNAAPEKGGIINGFFLKIVAIIAMTCNHVADVYAAYIPAPWLYIIYGLGGLTFPIMAFLLVEGYHHTHNVRSYAIRLGIFAIIAQIPYTLLWGATLNVLFTLLVGLLILYANDHMQSRPLFIVVLLFAVVLTVGFDWGAIGIILIFLYDITKEHKYGVIISLIVPLIVVGIQPLSAVPSMIVGEGVGTTGVSLIDETAGTDATDESLESLGSIINNFSSFDIGSLVTGSMGSSTDNTILSEGAEAYVWGQLIYVFGGFILAAILLINYNGRRGPSMKWFFYAYYPAHLLVIWYIA
ncbi:MAG: conjugal transfer protein TraX, partial [Eggerthellaceae bacterium]|nr:conjugal transfer protein TraX [Eggerthellaceae bacterium]